MIPISDFFTRLRDHPFWLNLFLTFGDFCIIVLCSWLGAHFALVDFLKG